MAAIDRQTLVPDEIIIVDGGSVDGTFEMLADWKPSAAVRVVRVPGSSISAGRNRAIELAQGEVIAVTDAGTKAREDWLEQLVHAIDSRGADVASGFFVPVADSLWASSLAATTFPNVAELDTEAFLPSSRSVAFRKAWFDAGMRYPGWLDYGEDLVFDLAMLRAGARFTFVPEAIVDLQVRDGVVEYWQQYFRYARGDGKAGLYSSRHALRYLVYFAALVVAVRRRPGECAGAVLLGLAYVRQPIRRVLLSTGSARLGWRRRVQALALIPLLRLWGDLAKMAGYPTGLAWRVRRYRGIGPAFSWRRIDPRTGSRRP